jgi:pilus assembly protein Flp/PilA
MCGSNQNWESVVMKTVFTRFVKDESGATAIEYGLIAAIVAVGIIIGLQNLRDGLNTMFNNLKTQVTTSH